MTRMIVVSTPATQDSITEKRRSPTWNSVSGCRCPSPAAIAPNAVDRPVATTTPLPRPQCTTVPISAQPANSANGVPDGTGAQSFATAADSPVSTDSSHSSCSAESNRMSAGTTMPSSS